MKPSMSVDRIQSLIRDVPDFPKPGILFKDITPVLADGPAFEALVLHLSQLVPKQTTKLVAIESRGFILGAAMAMKLGIGMVLVRKPGKLPAKTLRHSYALEYGEDTLHMHADALNQQDRVCIVDDVLATGGTAQAAEVLCLESGAKISGFVFLLELGFLNGRQKLRHPAQSLITL